MHIFERLILAVDSVDEIICVSVYTISDRLPVVLKPQWTIFQIEEYELILLLYIVVTVCLLIG